MYNDDDGNVTVITFSGLSLSRRGMDRVIEFSGT